MTENNPDTGREDYNALVSQVLKSRRKVKVKQHNGWSVTCYVGYRPSSEQANVSQIEYSAYAKTGDIALSQLPELSNNPRAIRVDFDDTSVVTLVSDSMENLTRSLQNIFQGFLWENEEI